MNPKEIEIKIKLTNKPELISMVVSLGGRKTSAHSEYDIMYNDQSGSFDVGNKTGKHLRLRKSEIGNLLTYKENDPDDQHDFLLKRTEIQTAVENFDVAREILE